MAVRRRRRRRRRSAVNKTVLLTADNK